MNTKEKGRFGERAAAQYLTEHGYHIRERNFRSRHGEIDLVADDGETLIFVEVKARAGARPAEAVNYTKQRRFIFTARYYLAKTPTKLKTRLDIVEVFFTEAQNELRVLKINHIENAFGAGR
ncbi:MAG TPA: YraN family protein [Candidatus Acidoferrum sp.]|nr:YraN family protein [Candidatus Acidoferrum sp.]